MSPVSVATHVKNSMNAISIYAVYSFVEPLLADSIVTDYRSQRLHFSEDEDMFQKFVPGAQMLWTQGLRTTHMVTETMLYRDFYNPNVINSMVKSVSGFDVKK